MLFSGEASKKLPVTAVKQVAFTHDIETFQSNNWQVLKKKLI
jgi:hypothetical protein